jgi:hypothetical protein
MKIGTKRKITKILIDILFVVRVDIAQVCNLQRREPKAQANVIN